MDKFYTGLIIIWCAWIAGAFTYGLSLVRMMEKECEAKCRQITKI